MRRLRVLVWWIAFGLLAISMLPVILATGITRVFPENRDGWVPIVSVGFYALLVWMLI